MKTRVLSAPHRPRREEFEDILIRGGKRGKKGFFVRLLFAIAFKDRPIFGDYKDRRNREEKEVHPA